MKHPQEPMATDRAWGAVAAEQDAGTQTQVRKAPAGKSSG